MLPLSRRLFWNTKEMVSINSSLGMSRTSAPPTRTLPLCTSKNRQIKVCQRGFAAAGGANESHHLTRLNFQRNALDNLGFAIIAEMHILQRDTEASFGCCGMSLFLA